MDLPLVYIIGWNTILVAFNGEAKNDPVDCKETDVILNEIPNQHSNSAEDKKDPKQDDVYQWSTSADEFFIFQEKESTLGKIAEVAKWSILKEHVEHQIFFDVSNAESDHDSSTIRKDVLKNLKKAVEDQIKKSTEKAILVTPSWLTDDQSRCLHEAATQGGFGHVETLPLPFATTIGFKDLQGNTCGCFIVREQDADDVYESIIEVREGLKSIHFQEVNRQRILQLSDSSKLVSNFDMTMGAHYRIPAEEFHKAKPELHEEEAIYLKGPNEEINCEMISRDYNFIKNEFIRGKIAKTAIISTETPGNTENCSLFEYFYKAEVKFEDYCYPVWGAFYYAMNKNSVKVKPFKKLNVTGSPLDDKRKHKRSKYVRNIIVGNSIGNRPINLWCFGSNTGAGSVASGGQG